MCWAHYPLFKISHCIAVLTLLTSCGSNLTLIVSFKSAPALIIADLVQYHCVDWILCWPHYPLFKISHLHWCVDFVNLMWQHSDLNSFIQISSYVDYSWFCAIPLRWLNLVLALLSLSAPALSLVNLIGFIYNYPLLHWLNFCWPCKTCRFCGSGCSLAR